MRSVVVAAVLGIVLVGIGAFALVAGEVRAANVSVEAGNNYFCSSGFAGAVCETNVTAGDTVTWNVSGGFHTVTECDASFSTCPPAGGFNSGDNPLETGGTFAQTFAQPGTYAYYCAIHPSEMRGRVIVAQPTPTPVPTAVPTPVPPGQTAAPTAIPVSVPKTGGPPAADSAALWLMLIGAGATLLVTSGGIALATVRKR